MVTTINATFNSAGGTEQQINFDLTQADFTQQGGTLVSTIIPNGSINVKYSIDKLLVDTNVNASSVQAQVTGTGNSVSTDPISSPGVYVSPYVNQIVSSPLTNGETKLIINGTPSGNFHIKGYIIITKENI